MLSLGLLRRAPNRRTRYITNFYKHAKEISQASANLRELQNLQKLEERKEYFEKNKDLISLRSLYSIISKRMSNYRRRIKAIKNSDLPSAEKASQVERLELLIAQAAKIAEERRLERIKSDS